MPWPSAASLRHFLTLDGLGPDGLRLLLDLSGRLKREPEAFRNRLAGGRIGMIFDKPSTRTRVSLESAAWTLGMLPIVLRPDELQLGRGETIADTARALSLYLDALTVRTFAQASVEELGIRGVDPRHQRPHRTSTTRARRWPTSSRSRRSSGRWPGIQVAFVGDGDNVCHSLIQAAGLAGFELRVATPPGYEPSETIVAAARSAGHWSVAARSCSPTTRRGRRAQRRSTPMSGRRWARRPSSRDRRAAFAGFTVDSKLMRRASASAIFLHCLPAHRGEEVTDEVIDGPASRVWPQADNRLHTETALLYTLLTGDRDGERLR